MRKMSKRRDEIKAEVLAEIEKVLNKGLEEGVVAEALTITEIEEIALRAQKEVGEKVTKLLVEENNGADVPGPVCKGCGKEMHYKGKKRRYVRSRSGEIQVERAYYYCERCKEGYFPPG